MVKARKEDYVVLQDWIKGGVSWDVHKEESIL